MEPLQLTLTLIGIVIIIIAAYYATYYIGVKASGQNRVRFRNRNINLIDRFAFSRDKSFCLVEIAGKVYVIGITNQTMTLLDTLDAAAFAETGIGRGDAETWPAMPGGRLTGRLTKKLASFIARKTGRPPDVEDESGPTFAGSMKKAREDEKSGQSGRVRETPTDDSGGYE